MRRGRRRRAPNAHRALAKIAAHFGRDLGDFAGLHYLARAGPDNTLVARTRTGDVLTTAFYDEVQQVIGDLKPDLLTLDNSSHVAGINENDGSEVTKAWNLLHGLMRPTGGTTILCGRVPENGLSECAGNAAWENVARSRLFLGSAEAEPGGGPVEDDPRRGLRRGRSNADGTASVEIVLDQGAFRLAHPDVAIFGDRVDRGMR